MTQSAQKIEYRAPTDAEMQAYIAKAHQMRSEAVRNAGAGLWKTLRDLFTKVPTPSTPAEPQTS